MKKDLKNISANNNLDFYFNEKNIPAQDVVKLTHDYFENGVRKGIFKPLDFLNLLWEQYNFVVKNINDAEKVITTLNTLPLSKEKKHILFGFILKWFGGYPINHTPKEYDITLKLIEKEFLEYNESTPEKKFCQKELERINEMKKVSNYLNDLLKKSQNYKGVSLNEYIDEINPLEETKEQCEIIFTDLAKDIEENRKTTKDVLKGLDLLISAYSTPNIKHNINNDRIIFFKDYLEAIKKRIELLYSTKEIQQPKREFDNKTKKVIFEAFNNMDKKGWEYAFKDETNFNLFIDLLTDFFEYKDYVLPEKIIQLKRDCKTKVAKALGEIHKELSNEDKLSTDEKYFEIIKILSPFENEVENDLYKALTR